MEIDQPDLDATERGDGVNAIVDEITNNTLTKISQKTLPELPEPETIVIDTDVR